MNIKILISTIAILAAVHVTAQNKNENNIYYSRYEGVVDSTIIVTANIVRLFDNLTGNYSYQQEDNNDELKSGGTITIVGDIVDNEVKMKEYGRDNYTFMGSINQQSFNGLWNSPTRNNIPINITENYPAGTLPFDVHYLHSEDKLVRDSINSPAAEIELTLIYPIIGKDNNISDSLIHIIADSFFGVNFFEDNPDSMLTKFESEYYTNYRDQNLGRSIDGASFNWQKTVNMSVIHNSDYILCLEYMVYAYTGGAHGMTKVSYSNVNLQNGEILTFEDIFKEGVRDSLSKILTQQLYLDKKIPYNISLIDAGYFVEKIEPNHNLFIENNGIGFLYNSYEIAPYSFGQTSIFLDYDLISDFISEESTVKNIRIK